ncbi:MAG TPA: sigma-70 family RNA polymerase sigma factor [Nitrospirota bacterium]|nr:sigma-70 family RNA polymerase sigma factor [Nitrospirota bacterium]
MPNGTNSSPDLSYPRGAGAASDPDAQLVEAARAGDLGAFETLVSRHQKRMLNIAYRFVDDYDEACDIVQEAFVSAFRHIGAFRGDAKFSTWMTTITVNCARNRLQQLKAKKGHEAFSLDEPIDGPDGDLMRDPPSDDPSALRKLEQEEIRARVQQCVRRLEPEFREVLVLRDLQDFSYEEISGILNLRAGTVKSRLFRAREMIKECLKRVLGDLV